MDTTVISNFLLNRSDAIQGNIAGMRYDFGYKPEHSLHPYMSSILHSPATTTGSNYIRVSFDPLPQIHHDIEIWSTYPLTIFDVLTQLYEYLHRPLTPSDRQTLRRNETVQAAVWRAYYQRVPAALMAMTESALEPSLVDLMLMDTTFRGLQPRPQNTSGYDLMLGRANIKARMQYSST